ncbi:MAG: hypothetical protein IT249_16400 [Chitinophagaceae bacterium]|nr:hypothetical protein [Chitinophagaceae bacterium]
MIKFVYIASLAIMSFLLFIFSKDKVDVVCNSKATGKIEFIKDSSRNYLGIVTDENKILYPSSMSEEVVLAAGQRVVICYSIDSSLYKSEQHPLPVYIGSISYVK